MGALNEGGLPLGLNSQSVVFGQNDDSITLFVSHGHKGNARVDGPQHAEAFLSWRQASPTFSQHILSFGVVGGVIYSDGEATPVLVRRRPPTGGVGVQLHGCIPTSYS